MLEIITRLFPRKLTEHIEKLIVYSRVKVDKEKIIGLLFTISLIAALLFSVLISIIFNKNIIFVFILSFFVLLVGIYFTFFLKADANARFAESILPDVLHLMSSNLRAGLTMDKALILSSRPEFGILGDEINRVGKKLALGEDVGKALMEMGDDIKSEQLRKTLQIISSGLRSGGELIELLDQISKNLRQKMLLDEKIRTNILMYVIFIFVAISFGAPILFGFSSFLINVLEKNIALIELPPETTFIPVSFSKVAVSSGFIKKFSLSTLITTAILGSLVLGLIGRGNEKFGVKYIPILVILTISVFYLARFLASSILGGLFGL